MPTHRHKLTRQGTQSHIGKKNNRNDLQDWASGALTKLNKITKTNGCDERDGSRELNVEYRGMMSALTLCFHDFFCATRTSIDVTAQLYFVRIFWIFLGSCIQVLLSSHSHRFIRHSETKDTDTRPHKVLSRSHCVRSARTALGYICVYFSRANRAYDVQISEDETLKKERMKRKTVADEGEPYNPNFISEVFKLIL